MGLKGILSGALEKIDFSIKASFRVRASLSDSQFANWQDLVKPCLDYQAHLAGSKWHHL